jgi:serine/threonine-protein kinase
MGHVKASWPLVRGIATRVGFLGPFIAGIIFQTVPAGAETEDPAGARALFDEARALMRAGRYESACPKLEAASTLYRGSGILLNLGDCYEHVGRTASAWSAFVEAASMAARLGRADDEKEATRRQASLEPRLSRLSIIVAKETPDLVVRRDGARIDRGAWATPMPVDPGAHTIEATAQGHAKWETTVTVSTGRSVTVEVPELAEQKQGAAPPSAAPPTPAPSSDATPPSASNVHPEPEGDPARYWTGRRMLGASLAAGGTVAMGIGGVLGFSAKSQYDSSTGETGAARRDDSASAVSRGNVATVVFSVGAAVAVAGLVVWLTAPSKAGAGVPSVGCDGAHLLLRETF